MKRSFCEYFEEKQTDCRLCVWCIVVNNDLRLPYLKFISTYPDCKRVRCATSALVIMLTVWIRCSFRVECIDMTYSGVFDYQWYGVRLREAVASENVLSDPYVDLNQVSERKSI